jgi:hypothetical protein
MLDSEGLRITLLWVPSHKGIPGNAKADQAAKEALDEDIPTAERYPPDDLKKWFEVRRGLQKKTSKMEKRKQRDERKLDVGGNEDTKGMPRKEQVAISRLRTGYTRATHGLKMGGVANPLFPIDI